MHTRKLEHAIEDARRFADRASDMLHDAVMRTTEGDAVISEDEARIIRRLSLDVTHAMKELRDSAEKAEVE